MKNSTLNSHRKSDIPCKQNLQKNNKSLCKLKPIILLVAYNESGHIYKNTIVTIFNIIITFDNHFIISFAHHFSLTKMQHTHTDIKPNKIRFLLKLSYIPFPKYFFLQLMSTFSQSEKVSITCKI